MISLDSNTPLAQAVRLARERGLLPTALGTAALNEVLQRLSERVFFSARTTNAWYVERLAKLVERYVNGEGRDNDLAQLRVEARELLAQAGYTPEGGFPGDEELGIPPAAAGSLRDLSSEKRLNLIFETNAQMMRGLGQKLRGLDRLQSHPAWELVRYKHARDPAWERDWLRRFSIAAENVEWEGVSHEAFDQGRMLALKTSPVWRALGSSALFPDALNVDHAPFAFNSGMGLSEVGFRDAESSGLDGSEQSVTPAQITAAVQPPQAPRESAAMSDTERAAKLARFKRIQEKFDAIDARRASSP